MYLVVVDYRHFKCVLTHTGPNGMKSVTWGRTCGRILWVLLRTLNSLASPVNWEQFRNTLVCSSHPKCIFRALHEEDKFQILQGSQIQSTPVLKILRAFETLCSTFCTLSSLHWEKSSVRVSPWNSFSSKIFQSLERFMSQHPPPPSLRLTVYHHLGKLLHISFSTLLSPCLVMPGYALLSSGDQTSVHALLSCTSWSSQWGAKALADQNLPESFILLLCWTCPTE